MSEKKPIFVVQKHSASHLHYDVRLEIDGVLVSWAVPKGPSAYPADKRLAVPTPDHDMDWANFEGIIAEGQYGAGTVMVWDHGTYTNIKHHNGKLVSMKECLANGHIEVNFDGTKLLGDYAIIRTVSRGKTIWLVIKMQDEHASPVHEDVYFDERSALTGRTMAQITKEG